MRKCVKSIALVLALVLCLSVTAFASETLPTENDLAVIESDCVGATVVFASNEGTEDEIQVTYTGDSIQDGAYYLVAVLAGSDRIPTGTNVYYLGQVAGVGNTVTCSVYTSDTVGKIQDSTIVIYGADINPEEEVVNTLVVATVKTKYILGDVNGDKKVSALDALAILQFLVNKAELTETQKLAGNVDGLGSEPSSVDALMILQSLVGKITL